MKVLICTPTPMFHPELQAMTRHQLELARHLNGQGVETAIVSAGLKGWRREESVAGVRILRLPGLFNRRGLRNLAARALPFRVLVRRERPDIVQERFCLLDAGWSVFADCATVLQLDAPQDQHMGGLRLAVEKAGVGRVLGRADGYVSMSRELKDHFVGEYGIDPARAAVVADGVDPAQFRPCGKGLRRRFGIGRDEVVVGFMGQFYRWHGVERILAIAQSLKEVPIRFVLIGGGVLFEDIRRKVAESGMEGRVILTGRISLDAVPEHLSMADMFIAPYPEARPDGVDFYFSPLKLFECLAMGRPLIAPPFGQMGEILSERVGVVVRDNTNQGYVEAIRRLAGDRTLCRRLGRAGRRLILREHTWAHRAEALTRFYMRVLAWRRAESRGSR